MTDIERTLALFCGSAVTEIRLFPKFGGTVYGYFDDYAKAAKAVTSHSDSAEGVYFTFNEIDPSLLSRSYNRCQKAGKNAKTTSDGGVTKRRWMLVDFDAKRQAGVCSTDEEKEHSRQAARSCWHSLASIGWPEPVVCDSGNGYHLMYRIDQPVNDDGLIANVLLGLDSRFSTDAVDVDKKVFNPARITKLYGTFVRKGDDTPDRPHRPSSIIVVPDEINEVTTDQLQGAARWAPQPEQVKQPYGGYSKFELADWIANQNVPVSPPRSYNGRLGSGRMWEFAECPYNPEHKNDARIIQFDDGKIHAGCFHNSCANWGWREIRQMFEPGCYDRPVEHAKQTRQDPKLAVRKVEANTLIEDVNAYLAMLKDGTQQLYELYLPDVDYAIGGGVESGEMVIIGARPSHGKSAIALQIIHGATEQGHACLFISEEMSRQAIAKRAIQFFTDVPTEHWKHESDSIEREMAHALGRRAPCYVCESVRNVQTYTDVVKKYAAKGVKYVVLDYAQLLTASGHSRYEQVTEVSAAVRRTATECNIIAITLCQLNRQVEDRKTFTPRMSDLKDTGQIEQDADVVLLLSWPHRNNAKEDAHTYHIYVEKNRNRAIMQQFVTLRFEPSRQRIVPQPISEHANYNDAFAAHSGDDL